MITKFWKIAITVFVLLEVPSSVRAQSCYERRATVEGALPARATIGASITTGTRFSPDDETSFYVRLTKTTESQWRVVTLSHVTVDDPTQLPFGETAGILNFDSEGRLIVWPQIMYQPLSSRLERAGSNYAVDFAGIFIGSDGVSHLRFVANNEDLIECKLDREIEWAKTVPDRVRDELNPIIIE